MPEFHASCPACKGYTGKFTVKDEADDTEKKIRVKHWSVHEIEILHDLFTDEAHYVWRIPEDYKRQIRDFSKHGNRLIPPSDSPWCGRSMAWATVKATDPKRILLNGLQGAARFAGDNAPTTLTCTACHCS